MHVLYDRVKHLPAVVRSFCFNNDAWLVGSGAAFLLDVQQTSPRDWDVLVPLAEWNRAAKAIPVGTGTNSQGGVHPRTMRFIVVDDAVDRYTTKEN